MDLSQVKLVVSDMDGTLLNSKHEISANFLKLFNELKKYIHFVVASGRQYQSICYKLNTIKNDITIIAENGGIIKRAGRELASTKLPIEKVMNIIPLIREVTNSYAVLCGKKNAYIETQDEHFISLFDEYYIEYKIVDDLTMVNSDDFLKIAIYHFESSEKFLYPSFKAYEGELQIKVSGKNWLDISHPNANKGYSLKQLQDKLGIRREETMVFGDYNNDLEMLALADFSYAMQNAIPSVKKLARFVTKSNDEQGVEFILEQLLMSKQ